MMGKLYVVGTPIGNLGDMTYRAVETLKSVDFICAEDTRVTAKLLNYFKIDTPTISYHEHNAKTAGETVLNRILAGENGAVVTDAGMPCISDPGEDLVRLCAENSVEINVVPGPSAAVAALAVSGLSTSRFRFEGFLSTVKKQRFEHLASVKDATDTLIFYEAPHKLLFTLKDMLEYFGDRKISLCRELTKIHEEIFRTTISEAVQFYSENKPKGEFVLIIEGAKAEDIIKSETIDEAVQKVKELVSKGMRGADACREIAKATKFSKSELYAMLVGDKSND
ncbi:MAG: 16S rRNA (cytidine(1402)-2'-O)-methyltransferase [Oscillospiraceae bacterium]